MGRTPFITNEQILEAARELFLVEGFGASTVEIARRAGISEGSIFKRFPTKEQLFFAAMGVPERPAWVKEIEALPGKGNLKENLITLSLQILEFFREQVPRLMMMHARGNPSPEMAGLRELPPIRDSRVLTAFLERELELGRLRPCEPKTAASILLGSLMNYILLEDLNRHASQSLDAPVFVQELVEILWQGMAPS